MVPESLGYSTLAIGALASLQSSTRLFSPYAWGWLADHTGRRTQLLRVAVAGALVSACGYFLPGAYAWIAGVTLALFISTSGVVPISEATLAQFVSSGATLDAGRYGRVRMWGSIGFIVAVAGSGALLQAIGVGWFPCPMVVTLLGALMVTALRLPTIAEAVHAGVAARGVISVLRQPAVAWFFAGVFFTVLAHTSLYAFFSLYLVSLGYTKTAVGLMWAAGVAAEVTWFWFQGRWLHRAVGARVADAGGRGNGTALRAHREFRRGAVAAGGAAMHPRRHVRRSAQFVCRGDQPAFRRATARARSGALYRDRVRHLRGGGRLGRRCVERSLRFPGGLLGRERGGRRGRGVQSSRLAPGQTRRLIRFIAS